MTDQRQRSVCSRPLLGTLDPKAIRMPKFGGWEELVEVDLFA